MATKQNRITSLPVTIEVDHRGVTVTDGPEDATFKQQVAAFKVRYQGKTGLPAGVIAACVVDVVTKKVVTTARNPLTLTQGKPTL